MRTAVASSSRDKHPATQSANCRGACRTCFLFVLTNSSGAAFNHILSLTSSPAHAQIAVPTSVGYGAAFAGISPLLSALTAGAPGVATVNIDNGFGGASAIREAPSATHGGVPDTNQP